jgi:hypothetical protein
VRTYGAPMESSRAIELPKAYALGLWLQDLGFDELQIADVLDMEHAAIRPLLEIARLKIDGLRERSQMDVCTPRGVLVLLDDTRQMVVDAAAELALERGGALHLVASRHHRAEPSVLVATCKAFRFHIDVVPHEITGRLDPFLCSVIRTWGPLTIVVDAESHEPWLRVRLGCMPDIDIIAVDGPVVSIAGLRIQAERGVVRSGEPK